MNRVLSITQARTQYLLRIAESKRTGTTKERHEADREVRRAVRVLQQAQMTDRLRRSRGRIPRPTDWNEELN